MTGIIACKKDTRENFFLLFADCHHFVDMWMSSFNYSGCISRINTYKIMAVPYTTNRFFFNYRNELHIVTRMNNTSLVMNKLWPSILINLEPVTNRYTLGGFILGYESTDSTKIDPIYLWDFAVTLNLCIFTMVEIIAIFLIIL